ncbi:GTP cyclohydrolase II [Bradymonas sediminis]|uniref:GTP cyclohydrolase-2 n=2 Tax=Bradymonas sediminis TaxID=1548548 RepID=A0A2Z4FG46_9DELT|nr:GTP cyclohydrolase II [Bradymonas sediminis]TDP62908.1 GTP cyclohydrolase II [Bradymonas sediminis]
MPSHLTAPPLALTPSTRARLEAADGLLVEKFAEAALPTKHGDFRIVAFINNLDFKEHVALVRGDLAAQAIVPTRIHSECVTGDVFGSLKCDCGEQLEHAQKELGNSPAGVILYMRQEGRGIGLANKIKAYSLQDQGMDTVEANLHLGFDDDLRDYTVAAEMLRLLGVDNISLITNNPRKAEGLRANGITVTERQPLIILPNPHNKDYLDTKRDKSGHLL